MMFDDVLTDDIDCKNCEQPMRIFQTKTFAHRSLRKIVIGEDVRKEIPECENNQTFEIHTFCDHCGYWHDAEGLVVDGIFTEIRKIKMGDKAQEFEQRGLKKA